MSFFMIVLAGAAVAAGLIQTISHLSPGGAKYLWGNHKAFGIGLELMVLWTTIISAGTVSALLVNTLAGLFAWGLLALGAVIFGGTKICWSWDKVNLKQMELGFYTVDIIPTLTLSAFADLLVNGIKSFFSGMAILSAMVFERLFSAPKVEPEIVS
jgi:hypothetical protein